MNDSCIQYRVDLKVIQLFVLIGVIGAGVLSYQFYFYHPRFDVEFDVLGNHHKINEMVKFQNKTYGKHQFEWNFGDSSLISVKRSPVHIYENPGIYQVNLLVDGKYNKMIEIEIGQEFVAEPDVVLPKIVGPTTVFVGKKFTLTCPVSNVKSYAWYVDGVKFPKCNKEQFNWVFKKPGYKSVTLVVNGDIKNALKRSIYVKQQKHIKAHEIGNKIVDEDSEADYIPETPDVYRKLNSIKKEDDEAWILPQDSELQVEFINALVNDEGEGDFVKYLNQDINYKLVFANQRYISFSDLVKELKGNEFVIKEFSTLRNDNRITKLTIRYRIKRRFL